MHPLTGHELGSSDLLTTEHTINGIYSFVTDSSPDPTFRRPNHLVPESFTGQGYNSCPTPSPNPQLTIKPKLGTYEIDRTIGKGIFSVVRLARHTITGINLAVKIIDKKCLDAENLAKVHRESIILKKLHHPNIVKLFQVMETQRLLCLVMEYLPNGEVFDYIATHGRFTEVEARVKFLDVLSAVDYTHSCGIVHRDLKAENLLFDADMNIKLIDFSFGTYHVASDPQSLLTTWCGSPPYAAPEIFKGEPYVGAKADIWSLGVVLYVMVCGMLPFDAQPLPHLKNQVLSASFRVPYWLSLTCERLIRSMLSKQPSKRPTAREIFQHPWFVEPLPWAASQRPQIAYSCNSCTDQSSQTLLTPNPSSTDSQLNPALDLLADRMSPRASTTMEPGLNLAADLELGRIDEFVLLIMESYGMSRTKIMDSLNSRAYDHLMATYLLLGEKIRQHRYSLNLPILPETFPVTTRATTCSGVSLDQHEGTGVPIVGRQPKHSRVDSAVGSVTDSAESPSFSRSQPTTDPKEVCAKLPGFIGSSASQQLFHSVDTGVVQTSTNNPSAFPLNCWSDGTEAEVAGTGSVGETGANPSSWLSELAKIPNTNDEFTSSSLQSRPTLARRKYGVSNPPACLDQIARALLAQQTAANQLEDTNADNF